MDVKTQPETIDVPAFGGSHPAELHWTVHPLRDEPPARSALLVVIVLGISIGIGFSFEGIGYGMLSVGLLAAALSRYFLPSRYAVDSSGVQVVHLGARRQLPWERIRRVRIFPDGVFLSPFARPSRLDQFRGCLLRFGKKREAVVRLVQAHVPPGSA